MTLSTLAGAGELRRFLKFVLVGVLNTIFGYGVFALVYLAWGDYRLGIVIATACGIIFNFFTTGRVVFANSSWRKLLPFVLGYAVVGGLNVVMVDFICAFYPNALLAQLIALPVLVLSAYLINSRLVFDDPSPLGRGAF